MHTFNSLIIKGDHNVIGSYDFAIVESTTNNRTLLQMGLLIVDADLLSKGWLKPSFTWPTAIMKIISNIRTTSHGTCCEVNVIQSKWWRDKLFLELSFYELSVIKNNIFSVFHSSTKSNAGANTTTLRSIGMRNKQFY